MCPPHSNSSDSAKESIAQTDCFNNESSSLTADQALSQILDTIQPIVDSESVPLNAAFGRNLTRDLSSPIHVPGFRNSAMDGYAYHSQSANDARPLECIGQSLAGHPFFGNVEPNQCIRVMTGAKVPDDTDTVVMQEHVKVDRHHITVITRPTAGLNVRDKGSNIRENSLLLAAGTRISAVESGLLSSVGLSSVDVVRKLKICIFSTGDELIEPGWDLEDGKIYDSNRFVLQNLLGRSAFEVKDLGIIPDSKTALAEAMIEASHADLVISSGGVSVGDADYVRETLLALGKVNLWKILMKPGRPLMHGALESGACYFGLPGNPVSGMVTFYQFVLPAIQKMCGELQSDLLGLEAVTATRLEKQAGRMELQRGILRKESDGTWRVDSTGLQDSHVLLSMSRANCFIALAIESRGANAGDRVKVIPFQNYQIP